MHDLPGPLHFTPPFPFVGRTAELERLRTLMPRGGRRGAPGRPARRRAGLGQEPAGARVRAARRRATACCVLYGACDAVVRTPVRPVRGGARPARADAGARRAARGARPRRRRAVPAAARSRRARRPAPAGGQGRSRHRAPPPALGRDRPARRRDAARGRRCSCSRTGTGRTRRRCCCCATWRAPGRCACCCSRRSATPRPTSRSRCPRRSPTCAATTSSGSGSAASPTPTSPSSSAAPAAASSARSRARSPRAIHDLTEGNAFLVCELWRALVETGTVELAGGTIRVTPPARPSSASPESVREVVSQRLARLAPRTDRPARARGDGRRASSSSTSSGAPPGSGSPSCWPRSTRASAAA